MQENSDDNQSDGKEARETRDPQEESAKPYGLVKGAIGLTLLTVMLYVLGQFIFLGQVDETLKSQMHTVILSAAGTSLFCGLLLIGTLQVIAHVLKLGFNAISGAFIGVMGLRMLLGLIAAYMLKKTLDVGDISIVLAWALFYLPLLTLEVVITAKLLSQLNRQTTQTTDHHVETSEVAA